MIRLITFRNFPLIDLQIEEAYRRRCEDERNDRAFVETIDDELLWLVREARLRRRQKHDWLQDLARQIETLSAKNRKRRPAGRRRAAAMAAVNTPLEDCAQQRSRKVG
jgi:hypothetical protein